jgi:hypothetical protein
MKKALLISALVFLFSCSSSTTPPDAVKSAFQQKYPDASNVKWGKENDKEWEAEFDNKGTQLSSNFDNDGSWIETEQSISKSEFPAAVTDAINKQYPGWEIVETDKTETASDGIVYDADLKSGSQKKEVAFKEDGTPVAE